MEELASIAISFDGGATSLNFAEAALLIQGSACVYSKKVEYLYALIFKVLDMISSKRERLARAPSSIVDGVDADAAGLAAEREESLLLLDDIVKPARNIDLIEPPLQPLAAADASMGSGGGTPSAVNAGVRTPGGGRLTSRAPLAMMASFGGGNDSFRVVTASVHASGALVLDESMGGRAVSGLVGARGRENATSSPTTAAPDDAEPGAVLFDSYGDGMSDGDGDQPDVDLMPGPPADAEDVPRARDLWALADPDDAHVVASRPFKRGRLPTAAALAPATAAAALATDFSEYVDATARRCVSMVAAAPHMAFGVLYALERSRRAARRRAAASAAATRAAAARLDAFDAAGDGGAWGRVEGVGSCVNSALVACRLADDDYGWYGPDVDGGDDNGCDDGGSGFEAAVPAAADAAPDVAPLSFDDAVGAHDATEGGSTYEALCRAHIERFMRGAHAFAAESQLSRRVATWQGRLEPMLAEEEARPAFDIRACGESIVSAAHISHAGTR